MDVLSEGAMRLYKIRKTVLEMLRDRGYLVVESEIKMSEEDFKSKYGENVKREDLEIQKSKKDNPEDKIYVFFPNEAKVGVKPVKDYANRMVSDGVLKAILVVQKQLTPIGKTAANELSPMIMEVFQETELLINVAGHELVPKHELLSDADKKDLLERYTVKETQLPRILVTDPVARYYGLKRGQVVKITRPSETAGKYITYRFVV